MTDRPSQRKDFDSEGISVEAASWVLQIENGSLNKGDRAALQEWLGRSPAHAQALREHAAAWMAVDDLMLAASDAEKAQRKFWRGRLRKAPAGGRRSWSAAWALASLAVLLFAVATFWGGTAPVDYKVEPVTYATRLGEQAQFRLTDGSIIHLNTDSKVEVEYQPVRRLIRLAKGEAYFEVAPDKRRPFDVIAGGKRVSAVGTAFNVYLTAKGLNVVVTEGVVGVAQAAERPVPAEPDTHWSKAEFQAMLEPNEKMVVEEGHTVIEKLGEEAVGRQLSWRDGVLQFEDDSLAYVISEVSRYTDTRIVLADQSLGTLRVGGLFKSGEVSSLLRALELSFDLQVRNLDAKTIEVSQRQPAKEEG